MPIQKAVAFKGQKFNSLRGAHLKKGELFLDPEFPANNKSLFFSKNDSEIEWKRPQELCKVPKLVVEGVTCDDLNEGELGNTWFVSACSSLAQEPKLFARVVPNLKDQEYSNSEKYAGILHFQFWRYGQWIDVVIDDLLPTKGGKLVFCHSNSRNEFWSALLEKAYAKLYGDYETLVNGFTADALVDFTGGVAEKLILSEMNLNSEPLKLQFLKELMVSVDNKSLVTTCIACKKDEIGRDASFGLVKGHGYGITDVKDIKLNKGMKAAVGAKGDTLLLVRLRNPWSTKEWTGAWSDESPEWKSLSSKDRDNIGIKFAREGEFWMNFDDFIKHFTNVDICHFVNTSIFSLKKTWSECLLHGEWLMGARGTAKDRAGGCDKHPTFLFNPQYVFDITGEEDTMMVSLEQNDVIVGKQTGADNNQIGFHIMKVEDNRRFRVHIPGVPMAISEYKESRNIFHKVTLPKGRYVIIPSTLQPGVIGKFLLRMYTGANSSAREFASNISKDLGELKKEFPTATICSKPYVIVTRVKVIRGEGFERKTDKETVDPYVIVRCEGESVKSHWRKDTLSAEWDFKCIFYRKKPQLEPVYVEVWNRNRVLVDEFMGMATITDQGSEEAATEEYELFGKKKKELEIKRPGKISVEITTTEDLTGL